MTDDELYATLLAMLPGCGPARLGALLGHGDRSPRDVWDDIVRGRLRPGAVARGRDRVGATLVAAWRRAAAAADPAAVEHQIGRAGVRVLTRGSPDYPALLARDPEPPAVLFGLGAIECVESSRARVAIVGTRRSTGYGDDVARSLGRQLSMAGVVVVSGLAAGIDGAAHEGVLGALNHGGGAPPVGVVGSGLDVVYPRRHRRLWHEVGRVGLLLSEAPLGAAPEPWRFPLRNRIIAALVQVVVVVESHAAGGSMHTVQAAIDRGVTVMAVPGSVRSPSSAGTNRLLSEGVPPVLDVDDVLVALSLHGARAPSPSSPGCDGGAGTEHREPGAPHGAEGLDAVARTVLHAVDWAPTPTEDVLRRTALDLGAAAAALARLEMAGLVRGRAGCWERR